MSTLRSSRARPGSTRSSPATTTAWLLGIIVNLLTLPGYFGVALRVFGLLVGAVALARLAEGERRARGGR